MKKQFNIGIALLLVLSLVLTACGGSGSATTVGSSEQVEQTTTTLEKTDTTENQEVEKTTTLESSEETAEKTSETEKNTEKGMSEEDFQMAEKPRLIPLDELTYEDIINRPAGQFLSPENVETVKLISQKKIFASQVVPVLKTWDPISDDISDEELEELYIKLNAVGGYDYTPLDSIENLPYVIFKDDKEDPWTHRKVEDDMQVNIEIVLDASGSMANQIGGESMMDIAKNSILTVLDHMPENANVGLRVFGHFGDNSYDTMELSCGANELIYPIEPLNVAGIEKALDPIQPTGWTSIALSIVNGVKDLEQFKDEKTLNILYIITDGVETCGGDPVLAAQKLKDSGTDVVLGIIGFNVNAQQNRLLQDIAKAGGGYYSTASDAANLTMELSNIHSLLFTNYEWGILSDGTINTIENKHQSILSWNEHTAEYEATREVQNMSHLCACAEDGSFALGSDGAKIFSYKLSKRLKELAESREDKVKSLYMDKYNELEKQSKEYIEYLKTRKGETVAIIPSTSRLDRFDENNWHRNTGGNSDSAKEETEQRKSEQEENIDELENQSETTEETTNENSNQDSNNQ